MLKRIIRKILKRPILLELPRISFASVIAKDAIKLYEPVDKPGGLTLEELAIVIGICLLVDNVNFFEIGAFRGRTTINIAKNCCNSNIVTLDLPIKEFDETMLTYKLLDKDKIIAEDKERGELFYKYSEVLEQIKRLFGDSANYDYSNYYSKFDVVFIDGSHKYENVIADSENAIKLIKESGGVILWHDYAIENPEVVKAIHFIKKKYTFKILHIKRTKLAYLKITKEC